MKKIAIIQSNYIPWKGYFDIIHDVDVFVFLDDVQMTKRDWRTRNKIKTPNGTEWLTIPVKGGREQLIFEAEILKGDWQKNHLKSLQFNYGRTPFFNKYDYLLDDIYNKPYINLSEFNRQITQKINDILGIKTELISSTSLESKGKKDDKIIEICQLLNADLYMSGPSARDYINPEKFQINGIELIYKDYSDYPEYSQLFPPFTHYVSILDLLFNTGPDAPYYIWGWREHSPS